MFAPSFVVKIASTPIFVTVFGIMMFSIIATLNNALSLIFVIFSVKIIVLTFEFAAAAEKMLFVPSPIETTFFPLQVDGTINTSYG